jgi:hypothetical protein
MCVRARARGGCALRQRAPAPPQMLGIWTRKLVFRREVTDVVRVSLTRAFERLRDEQERARAAERGAGGAAGDDASDDDVGGGGGGGGGGASDDDDNGGASSSGSDA